MYDELAILESRSACLWSQFCTEDCDKSDLAEQARALDDDLEKWADTAGHVPWLNILQEPNMMDIPDCSVRESNQVFGRRMKINWLMCRIFVAWIQEGISGSSSKALQGQRRPCRWRLSGSRLEMVAMVYTSEVYAFGTNHPDRECIESTANMTNWVRPLYVAGISLLEELDSTTVTTTGGEYAARNGFKSSQPMALLTKQFEWVLKRLSYIMERLGDSYAAEVLSALQIRKSQLHLVGP